MRYRFSTFFASVLLLTCLDAGAVDSSHERAINHGPANQGSGGDMNDGPANQGSGGDMNDGPANQGSGGDMNDGPANHGSGDEPAVGEPRAGSAIDRSAPEEQWSERRKEKELNELSKLKKNVRPGNAPCLTWLPANGKPKAVILCIHGLGLHNGTYADFGRRMASLGYATYAIDVRGFGSFMEAKGRESVDFDGCLNDVQSTLKVLHRAHMGLPLYLFGESMGGAIALRATAIYPDLVDGLISSVPANDRFKQNHTRLSVAIHLLENPDKPFDVGKDIISQATEKQELRDQWSKDPLNKLNLSPNELLQFQHFMNQNHKCAKLITSTPVLFVQGCRDKLVKPEGTVELFNELATKDRQLDLIANGEHLIFEENQFTDEGINKVNMWIDAHISIYSTAKNPISKNPTLAQ